MQDSARHSKELGVVEAVGKHCRILARGVARPNVFQRHREDSTTAMGAQGRLCGTRVMAHRARWVSAACPPGGGLAGRRGSGGGWVLAAACGSSWLGEQDTEGHCCRLENPEPHVALCRPHSLLAPRFGVCHPS